MDVPAFQPISPMAGLELDPASNGHTHIPPSLTFEDEMMEAFYPPHQGLTSAAPVAVPLFHHSNPPPPEPSSPSSDVSSQHLAVLQSLQAQHQFQARQQHYYWQHQQEQHQQQQIPRKSAGIRKKKTEQLKTVYKVPAQNILTVDKWAWRKYGQKPIKGSPFPRNYYRCSSSKGCTARKQVERSITEPEVYVVTYTGDHFHPWPLHRNALAGISRSDHRSCAYSSAHRHDLMSVCHVAISESPSPQLPPPSEEVEEEGLLIPNRKYVDEDMLRGMEELGKWKGTSTTTTSTPNGSDSGSGSQLDGPNFY